jgi:hypothetical protein
VSEDTTKKPPEHRAEGESNDPTAITSAAPQATTPDALKGAPGQVKKQVWEMMAATFSAGHLPHPLFEKLEPGHIDKFLDYSHEDDKREHEHRKAERWFRLTYFLMVLFAFFGLVWVLLPSNQPLLQDLLKILVAFAGGFGAGYGYKAARRRGE